MTTPSRSQKVNNEITSLLRSRASALWITSSEESRVEAALMNSLPPPCVFEDRKVPMNIRFWDCVSGLTGYTPDGKLSQFTFVPPSYGEPVGKIKPLVPGQGQPLTDPQAVLQAIREVPDRCLYVLRDINAFKDAFTLRALRNTANEIGGGRACDQRAIVILTPSSEIPQDLSGLVKVIDYPLPDRQDVEKIFRDSLKPLRDNNLPLPSPEVTSAAIDAALGLSAAEMQSCFNRSIVTEKCINPLVISQEKKRVLAKDKLLIWKETEPKGLSAIGGLENVKDWLVLRQSAYTQEARDEELPLPKGIVLCGVPGTGKTLIARCIAAHWGVPLLALDLGATTSKWQGESQANIRKACQIIVSMGRCVVLLDEFEKQLAGASNSEGDGGVAADQSSTLLQFFQERDCQAFFIATMNDPRKMPPEIFRKGRFDEFFWVALPTETERKQILLASIRPKDLPGLDLSLLSKKTDGFTGSEIAALIGESRFLAFNDGKRALTTEDILKTAESVVPLSVTSAKKLDEIQEFMKDKARPASKSETKTAQVMSDDGPGLDLG